jgi:hypothetical protein
LLANNIGPIPSIIKTMAIAIRITSPNEYIDKTSH